MIVLNNFLTSEEFGEVRAALLTRGGYALVKALHAHVERVATPQQLASKSWDEFKFYDGARSALKELVIVLDKLLIAAGQA